MSYENLNFYKIIIVIISYLLGSISGSMIIGKLKGIDIRDNIVIPDMPAANPSKPSIQLIAFVIPTSHIIVSIRLISLGILK